MSVCTLARSNYSFQLVQHYSSSRSSSFAIAVHLAEQVDVAGQLLRCVFHLIFQLLVLCLAHPSSVGIKHSKES